MKPGRELDQLIAEKVMGWPGHTWHAYWHDPDVRLSGKPAGRTVSFNEPSVNGRELELPHYSTDIPAAWEVVEKMKSTHTIELIGHCYHGQGDANGWSVNVDGMRLAHALDTAPYAICLAALKALEK